MVFFVTRARACTRVYVCVRVCVCIEYPESVHPSGSEPYATTSVFAPRRFANCDRDAFTHVMRIWRYK